MLSPEMNAIVYRPTVRYAPVFNEYVNGLFHCTDLDRNQIMRLALFASPYSGLFLSRLDRHMKEGFERPGVLWTQKESTLWKELL